MNEAEIKILLASLPVSWWEADSGLSLVDSGGGAFGDERTARRFLETLRADRDSSSGTHGTGTYQTRFEGRTFDVNWPDFDGRPGRRHSRGMAIEVGAPSEHNPYAALAELAPAAAFVRDTTGHLLWANHAYAHLYGTTREAVIGRHLADIAEPADVTRFLDMDQQVLAEGRPVRHTLTYQRADGCPGHAAGYRFPVRWNGARCVSGIYVDVTDYAQVLEQRCRAEADLRALRDYSGLACVRLTPDGRVSEAGAAVAEILRVRLSDLIGRPADTLLVDVPERTILHGVWEDLISGRRRSARTSAMLIDGEGMHRRARLHLSTVGGTAPGVSGVWAVVTHFGLRHQAQPSLTAAQVRILALLATGHSNAEIAEELHLSRQTVDYHLRRLRVLLEAPTRPALVARAYVLGILAPQAWPPRSPTAAHPSSPV
ncbi:PAS domain-containing protein [Streptomyces sp. NBC_01167]|uniref:PAS domain-containing protein n=1 Tax=Streptomyces sp. NBC_01167 TaxID=2903756 RepID=UPI0038694A54|nr:PAS domain-containing protein [Streptomyces sp. NBC_01167]